MKIKPPILSTLFFTAIIFPIVSNSNSITSNTVNHHSHNHHNQAQNQHQVQSPFQTQVEFIREPHKNQHQHQHHHHQQQQQPQATSENILKDNNLECGAHQSCQNGGSCVEGPNNFTCTCPEAFTGAFCEKDVNECSRRPNVCQNGATCLNNFGGYQCICVNGWTGHDCSENVDDCSTAACESGATCHDRVGHFYCECPPGKTGLLCQNDDGCFQNPCHPNATCDTSPVDGRAHCTCPAGFSGSDCSIDEDECAAGSPCEHGGSCVNTPGSYKCECLKGFTGSRCEININECEINPCMNDGTCLDEKGGYKCICMPGFTGQRCETDIDECAQNPCHHGAICKDYINSFRCLCPTGNWGERCQYPLNNSVPSEDNRETDAPGSTYLISDQNPWAKCSTPFECWTSFKDNKCDQMCNTAECLYDGNDCASLLPITRECDDDQCLQKWANGFCDEECNNSECVWDGADCQASSSYTNLAQGLLFIRVEPAIQISGGSLNTELAKQLRNISRMTKTILRIQNIRQVEEGRGTEIELLADNSKCLTSCYNSTDLIAKFLSALKSKTPPERRGEYLGLNMTDFGAKPSNLYNHEQQEAPITWYFVTCGIVVIFVSMAMVVSVNNKKIVKEKAVTWFPDGFKPVLSSRNRDPTDRRPGRGVSTLQAMGGQFFRGFKRNERNIATDTTEIDRCATSTPDGGGIYHEPYDQYMTYNGSIVNNVDEPMTPTPMPVNPINMEGPHGLTPLMVASMGPPFSKEPLGLVAYGTTGEINADNKVTDLLQRGAQLSQANKTTGETALHLAARHGRVDAARGLLERCDPQDVNAQDATGRTPLHAAIAADSLGVFELFIRCRGTDLNAHTHDGTTPLILAARTGTYSMLEELILNEAEVTKSDNTGKTALHWAAATNNVDAIRRLLAVRETNKDAQDLAEETPLFLAAREGAKGAVEILLSHNANKDISDQMDRSPIEIARSRQHYDIVRLLEEHEPPTPKSIGSIQHSSRQLSPFSPIGDSNSNSNSSTAPPPPSYHTHSLSQSNNGNGRQGGRQAQKAALARSSSTKPLIAEANIIRNNLQSHCKSVMMIKSEDKDPNECHAKNTREVKTLGRRATQSTSSSHQAIQPTMHMGHIGALSANNVVMPATPNSMTNSLSPVSSSMMSPPTSSLHHLNSPTKSNPPVNINQNYRQHNNQQNQVPPPAYDDCQTYWTNNNNPNMVSVNNNVIDKTHGLSEYNVPCLKNYMTPSPDSPFSLESNMASPPGVYNEQQYQNPNHPSLTSQKQAGVYI